MKPYYIAVTGTMGTGKTTVSNLLATMLPQAVLLKEAFADNPFLAQYYEDEKRWSLHSQLFFLLKKIEQVQQVPELQKKYAFVIQDTPIMQDVFSYAQAQYELGFMTSDEFALYNSLYELIANTLPQPDLIVYLSANMDILMERIAQRNRSFEAKINKEYLELLQHLNFEWWQPYPYENKIWIDSVFYDFVSNRQHQQRLVDLVSFYLERL